MTARPTPAALDPRIRLAALWASTTLIVAFVDLFGLYRADVREQLDAGQIFIFEINDAFLLGVIAYVAIPSLMVAASVVLPWRAARIANLVVAPLFAITIVGAALGEKPYYLLGSALELALLAGAVAIAIRMRGARQAADVALSR